MRGNRGEAQELRCGGDQFDALASLPVDFAQSSARARTSEMNFARCKNRDFAGRPWAGGKNR
jgi:hypothetical protein